MVPPRRPPRAQCHPATGQGFGDHIGARHDFDGCVPDFREFLQVYPSRFSNVLRRG